MLKMANTNCLSFFLSMFSLAQSLLSVPEKYLCKLTDALFKLIFIAVVTDFMPFLYRCVCHGLADNIFQN